MYKDYNKTVLSIVFYLDHVCAVVCTLLTLIIFIIYLNRYRKCNLSKTLLTVHKLSLFGIFLLFSFEVLLVFSVFNVWKHYGFQKHNCFVQQFLNFEGFMCLKYVCAFLIICNVEMTIISILNKSNPRLKRVYTKV